MYEGFGLLAWRRDLGKVIISENYFDFKFASVTINDLHYVQAVGNFVSV